MGREGTGIAIDDMELCGIAGGTGPGGGPGGCPMDGIGVMPCIAGMAGICGICGAEGPGCIQGGFAGGGNGAT